MRTIRVTVELDGPEDPPRARVEEPAVTAPGASREPATQLASLLGWARDVHAFLGALTGALDVEGGELPAPPGVLELDVPYSPRTLAPARHPSGVRGVSW